MHSWQDRRDSTRSYDHVLSAALGDNLAKSTEALGLGIAGQSKTIFFCCRPRVCVWQRLGRRSPDNSLGGGTSPRQVREVKTSAENGNPKSDKKWRGARDSLREFSQCPLYLGWGWISNLRPGGAGESWTLTKMTLDSPVDTTFSPHMALSLCVCLWNQRV